MKTAMKNTIILFCKQKFLVAYLNGIAQYVVDYRQQSFQIEDISILFSLEWHRA